MWLATLLTPVVIGRKYLPLHPVGGTCDHVWMSFFVAHSAYPSFTGLVTAMERRANMAADAANHPRPRYIHGVWSRKTHGNDLVHGMTCCCAHALLPVVGDAERAAD